MHVPPVGGKSTLYNQLCNIRKQTGKTPPQLQAYEDSKLPEELAYIYGYFRDFYNGGQFSYTELQSWQAFSKIELTYIEAELIRQLCLEHQHFTFKRQQAHQEYLVNNPPKPKGKK